VGDHQLLSETHTGYAKTQFRPLIWQGLEQLQPPRLLAPSQFDVMKASGGNSINLPLRLRWRAWSQHREQGRLPQ